MSTVWAALARALSPVEERPRVASTIESARYTTRSGADYVVVHNLAARAYARLDPREFELLPLMDGQHSVKELVIAYYQRHGVLALSRVAGLVNLLATHDLLMQPRVDAYARLGEQLRGRVALKPPVELTSQRVDALLGRAYQSWGHFFFHRAWLWFGIGLGVAGPLLVLAELARGRYALWDIGGSALLTVVVLVALALLALAVHELGHGLAVKHAGRHVHQAGLRLYFGLPAAYVDTSDIWMAAPRERLLTAFAGPWTGLILGGICAIAAAVSPSGPVGTLLFTAACVFLADNLFNFNPLLELDGYYMLIDYLDRPMLRARALAFVRGPLWTRLAARQRLVGEERLLAAFGLAAVAYALLATALAIRAWQGVLVPLVVTNWQSDDVLRQAGAAIVVAVLSVALALVVRLLVRRVAPAAAASVGWLGGRAAERRHREALVALRAVAVWADLPPARLLEVADAMRALDVAAGEEVIRQGEPGDCLYLIGRGAVEVVVDGQPQTRLGPGEYFGERALLQPVARAATVVALEPTRLFVLDRTAFESFLASDLTVRARLENALAYRQTVAEMPLFAGLSSAELDLLLARLIPITVPSDSVVIQQGQSGERFYVIRSGGVEVERDGHVLARLGCGEAFGEIALLLDVPRTATVRTVEQTELLALEALDFRDLLARYLGRAGELERLSHLRLTTHKRLDEVV